MKKEKAIFKVLKTKYLNCSINGNPKKLLVLEDENENIKIARTATDALCGYYDYKTNAKYLFTYHYTQKNANMIIDYYDEI